MTRPNIIRADTLDLQDHEQPSAQAHRHPAGISSNGALAPHQENELRHAQEERIAEQDYMADHFGSGRSSHEGSELLEEDSDFLLDNGPDPHDPRHDGAAMQQNGSHITEQQNPDIADQEGDEDLDDDGVDKISSSPSIEDEDIDFEFVYALHTFVATVEGQANATKGDTMVLLDDSNSYWWLVRVVKDSSIGYLPAEHIETPTERLARLNKHRNIDLAQSMLSDNQERSKNPLKKAMRRRNAKMVQFTAPVYFEPAENDWSDEEEGEGEEGVEGAEHDGDTSTHQDHHADEPEEARAETQAVDQDIAQAEHLERADVEASSPSKDTKDQSSANHANEDAADAADGGSMKSGVTRNGTIRNTDSFFKDETAEPRKISLTPGLLREEAGGVSRISDATDKSSATSLLEELEKTGSADSKSEKTKDAKAKKEKKPGKFSGLFKRKDKKIKVDEAVGGTVSKPEDVPLSPSAPATVESSAAVSPTTVATPAPLVTKTSRGKLTKPPPASVQQTTSVSQETTATVAAQDQQRELTLQIPGDDVKREKGVLSPLAKVLGPSSPDAPKKEKLKKAKTRMALDVDSSPENELADDYIGQPDTDHSNGATNFITPGRPAPPAPNRAPALASQPYGSSINSQQQNYDQSRSQQQQAHSQSSFVFHQRHNEDSSQSTVPYSDTNETHDVSTAATTPADHDRRMSWDFVALREYLDERGTQDIKDMLYIIKDHTDTKPVSMDHPIMVASGYAETQRRLDNLSKQLDGLLFQFLESRNMMPSPRPSVVR